MAWVEVFAVLAVSHLAGDYLLQTDWQARHKRGGLSGGDPVSRRALLTHIATYTLAFVPALVWIADDVGAAVIAVVAAISIPHLVQDDGRLLGAYMRRFKKIDPAAFPHVAAAVDQTLHLIALFLLALIVGD